MTPPPNQRRGHRLRFTHVPSEILEIYGTWCPSPSTTVRDTGEYLQHVEGMVLYAVFFYFSPVSEPLRESGTDG